MIIFYLTLSCTIGTLLPKIVLEKRESDKSNSFAGHSSYLAFFGGGADIGIDNNCNVNKNSYSNLGRTYTSPEGVKYNTPIAKNYLAGEYKFRVKEIEVYVVSLL